MSHQARGPERNSVGSATDFRASTNGALRGAPCATTATDGSSNAVNSDSYSERRPRSITQTVQGPSSGSSSSSSDALPAPRHSLTAVRFSRIRRAPRCVPLAGRLAGYSRSRDAAIDSPAVAAGREQSPRPRRSQSAVSFGLERNGRWPARRMTMLALIRAAISRCKAGEIMRSSSATRTRKLGMPRGLGHSIEKGAGTNGLLRRGEDRASVAGRSCARNSDTASGAR